MAAAGVVHSRYTSSPTVSLFHPRRLLCSSLSFLPSPATHKPRLFICRSNASFDDLTRDQAEEDLNEVFFGDGPAIDDESDDEEQDTESSVDLLLRFLQSMFRKVAKRAKKASRSVLPAAIPPQLVSFAVDGLLLLASLSILKALLEVACTLGGSVFVVILLLRVIWATASYFQSNGGGLNQGGNAFGAA